MSTHDHGLPSAAAHGYTREAIQLVLSEIDAMLSSSEHNAEHLIRLKDFFLRRLQEIDEPGD